MNTFGVFATGLLSSYCTEEDVLKLLQGYDLRPFTEEELLQRAQELLPLAKRMIDSYAGRDFLYHANETVVLDGTGKDRLQLTEAGVWPPLEVHALYIGGELVAPTSYCVYAHTGLIRLRPEGGRLHFPVGVQNIVIEVSWGEPEPPVEIGWAQAKLAAAELLAELGGEGGVVQETRIGDYAVRYAMGGRYASAITRLCSEALELLKPHRFVRMSVI